MKGSLVMAITRPSSVVVLSKHFDQKTPGAADNSQPLIPPVLNISSFKVTKALEGLPLSFFSAFTCGCKTIYSFLSHRAGQPFMIQVGVDGGQVTITKDPADGYSGAHQARPYGSARHSSARFQEDKAK